MPYTVNSKDLPKHVMEMDAHAMEVWVNTFNGVHGQCTTDGGSAQDCEGRAMAMANNAAERASKAGRRLSAASLELVQAAINALQKLLDGGADTEELGAVADALDELLDDQEITTEMMADPMGTMQMMKAEMSAREKLHAAQEARAKKYGIAPKDGGNLTPPADMPTAEADYGDPVNYAYPIDDAHIKPAVSYFNQSGQMEKGGYGGDEWTVIGKRIASRASTFYGKKYEFAGGAVSQAAEGKAREAAIFDIESACARKAVKVLDAETRRIGMYATVWGELDCDGERMTKKAIAPYIGHGAPKMFWMHGLDKGFGAVLVGKWDESAFKMDDLGLWVEGNVYKNKPGDLAWGRITKAGSYGASVGSAWWMVGRQKAADGKVDIIDWPLLEISIMEGGKQCVPSAQRTVKGELREQYREMAVKLGVDWKDDAEPEGGEAKTYKIGGRTVATETVDLDKWFEERMAAKAAADQKAAEEADARQREIDAAADTKAKALFERFVAEEAAKNGKKRPQVSPTGTDAPKDERVVIKMWSPYDRLATFDLAVKYELMRSYGKRPSERFLRALAERAVKMGGEEDTLYIKNGQPVKAPAIDWEVLVPKDLDIGEVDGTVFSAKAGQFDRYIGGAPLDSSGDVVTTRGIQQLMMLTKGGVKVNELTYSTQANSGDEWVPTLMSAQLWRTIRLNAAVLGLFQQFDMPSQPYDEPIESTDPVFYKVAEATDETQLILTGGPFTDSKVGTAKVTYSAGKAGAISYWSEEMEEDAIISSEQQFTDQYGIKMAHVIDEVLVSGDEDTGSTNISYYGAGINAASRFLIIDGLRDQAFANSDKTDAGALTVEDFIKVRATMGTGGKFGVDPNNLAIICDPATYLTSLLLGEILTMEKFGTAATILTGQLGSLLGAPVIPSEDYGLTDSSGYINNSGGSNTKGSFLTVNRRGIKVGWRRRPRVRVVGLPGAEARFIAGSFRLDIGFKEAGMAGLGYDVTI